jgi:hypothetical protein
MHSEPIGAHGEWTAGPDELVVSRDGDHRQGHVFAVAAGAPWIATATRELRRPLHKPMLSVIVDCTEVRVLERGEFAHNCGGKHGPPPHSIRVMVHEDLSDDAASRPLRAHAVTRGMSRGSRRALRLDAAVRETEAPKGGDR